MTVSIVGRTNVGKSRLFNRIIKKPHSVVSGKPGVTRDRISMPAEWQGKEFILFDTGGISVGDFTFQQEINRQVELAIQQSTLIIFLVSYMDGCTPDDMYISKLLKKRTQKILLVANKCDGKGNPHAFWSLGFGEPLLISAEHNLNIDSLLHWIVEGLDEGHQYVDRIKFAVLGRTNVGKSSLANALLKEERVIVSNTPGTTRDAVDLNFSFDGVHYSFIDTPGVSRDKDVLNKLSILRTKKALSRADVVLFMVEKEITFLDEVIGGLAFKANIPTIIVINKWDLEEQSSIKRGIIENNVRDRLRFLKWAPIVLISAKFSKKIHSIFKELEEIEKELKRIVNQSNLNEFLLKIKSLFSIPKVRGKQIRLKRMFQVKGQIPTFVIECDSTDFLHFSYSRMLENQFRNAFGFYKSPITFFYKTV